MSIQLLIVSSFLLFCLIHGLLAGRGVHTFKKFAVGDKNFTTATLVATLVATEIGAEILYLHLQYIYLHGLSYYLWCIIGMSIGNLLMSQWMTTRMQEFLKHLSIAESMGTIFGNKVRIITALFGILWCAGIISIQLQCITKAIFVFLDIESDLLLYISLSILTLYAMRGGIRAVTATDVIQFITLITFLLIMIYLVIKHIHNFKSLSQLLDQNTISFLHKGIKWTIQSEHIVMGITLIIPTMTDPHAIQRFYMTADVYQAKRTFTYAYGIITIMLSSIAMLALFLRIHHPNLNSNKLLNYLLFLHPSDTIYGFAAIAILSLAMSTADSSIHKASLLFTNDLAPFLKLSSNNKNQLLQARIATCITGIVALLFLLYKEDSWELLLFISSLYMPVVPIPFILAIFGFRPRTKSVLWGMGAGLMTTISFHYFGLDSYLHITFQPMQTIIAFLMHLLFLLGSRCLYSIIDDKRAARS